MTCGVGWHKPAGPSLSLKDVPILVDIIPIGCDNIQVGIEWTASADKHGIPHEEAQWAILHAEHVEPTFGEPRIPGQGAPTLYIGPSRFGTLEVLVIATPPRTILVFHVMPLRAATAEAVGYNQK